MVEDFVMSFNFTQQFSDTVMKMYEIGKNYNCNCITITSDMVNGLEKQNVVETNHTAVDEEIIISDTEIDMTDFIKGLKRE